MAERQAFGIDINNFSRSGGVNYELVRQHLDNGVYDFLITKAGLGLFRSVIYDEQREEAAKHGIPMVAYHLIDPRVDIVQQARNYISFVGTQEPVYILDIERPDLAAQVPPPNRSQVLRCIDEVSRLTQKPPILYSRISLFQEIGFMEDAKHFLLWMAQYLWDLAKPIDPLTKLGEKYTNFEDFVRDRGRHVPQSANLPGIKEKVILWQFTDKGAGRHYVFNAKTKDPQNPDGATDADLNASMANRGEFMQLMFGITDLPPIPDGHDVVVDHGGNVEPVIETTVFTYPGCTNQDMINFFSIAANNLPGFGQFWDNWIVPAGLSFLAIPEGNRVKPYTGPRIENIPHLTDDQKAAIQRARQG